MGLIVELEFGSGFRRVEIDDHKHATFVDELPVEPGSNEAEFLKDYAKNGPGAVLRSSVWSLHKYWQHEWNEAFVDALLEQGIEVFGDSMDENDIAKLFYENAYDHDDYDYIQHAIRFEKKENVLSWMINDLVDVMDTKGYHHPSASTIAKAMVGYIRTEEIEIELDVNVIESYGRRTSQHAEYTISVRGRLVANWTDEAIYEISDPVTFSGYVDEDYFTYPDGGETIRSNAIDFLSEFDLSLPKSSEPEPPDHPEPVEDGKYGVIHEYDEKFDMMPDLAGTWDVAEFGSAMDAMNATALAKDIYGNISSPAHVTLTPVRKLTPEEAEYVEKNFDYITAYAAMSGEPAPKEWQRWWKQPLVDEDEV